MAAQAARGHARHENSSIGMALAAGDSCSRPEGSCTAKFVVVAVALQMLRILADCDNGEAAKVKLPDI